MTAMARGGGEARAGWRRGQRGFVGLLLLLTGAAPLVVAPGHADAANLPQSAMIQLGALALIAAWLAAAGAGEAPRVAAGALGPPLLAFLGWSALSLAWAHNRWEAFPPFAHLLACALVFLAVSQGVRRRRDARRALQALFWSGCAVAALGIGQARWGVDWVPQAVPPAATFVNKNLAAQFVVIALPFGLLSFLLAARRRGAWVLATASAPMVAFVCDTGTRSAWLAGLAQALLLAAFAVHERRRHGLPLSWNKLAAAAWAALLVLGMLGLSEGGLGRRAKEARELVAQSWPAAAGRAAPAERSAPRAERSVEIRLAVWRDSLDLLRDSPLRGVGLGNYALRFPARARATLTAVDEGLRVDHAHNDFLELAIELGLVGLGLLGWLGLRALRALAGLMLRGDRATRYAAAGVGLSFAAILVEACFSFPLERAIPPFAAAVCLGVVEALGRSGPAERPRLGLAVPRGAVAALALLALVIASRWQWARLESDRHLLRLLEAQARHDWAVVLEEGREAQRWAPGSRAGLFEMGRASLALGRPEQAIAPLEALLAADPDDASALGNLALAYLGAGDSERAAARLGQRSALRPGDPFVRRVRASARGRATETQEEPSPAAISPGGEGKGCAGGVRLRLAQGRVALAASGVPLSDVLECLERKTGMKVVYDGATPPRQPVVVDLRGETVASAVQKLLQGQGLNYALGLAPDGAGVDTLILSASEAPRPAQGPPPVLLEEAPGQEPPPEAPSPVEPPVYALPPESGLPSAPGLRPRPGAPPLPGLPGRPDLPAPFPQPRPLTLSTILPEG